MRVDILLTCNTSSFTKKEFYDHTTNVIYMSMIGVSMLSVSTIILFDFRIVPTMCYFLFSISLYIYIFCYFFFLRLVDDDMLTFPVTSLASGLSWEAIIRFVVIGGIDYPQCLIFLFINNSISVSGSWEYWYFLHWNLYGKFWTPKAGTP